MLTYRLFAKNDSLRLGNVFALLVDVQAFIKVKTNDDVMDDSTVQTVTPP